MPFKSCLGKALDCVTNNILNFIPLELLCKIDPKLKLMPYNLKKNTPLSKMD